MRTPTISYLATLRRAVAQIEAVLPFANLESWEDDLIRTNAETVRVGVCTLSRIEQHLGILEAKALLLEVRTTRGQLVAPPKIARLQRQLQRCARIRQSTWALLNDMQWPVRLVSSIDGAVSLPGALVSARTIREQRKAQP